MVDDHPRQALEQLRVAAADRADPIERAAVGDDEQVVVGAGSGSVRTRPTPGQEVVQRRNRIREDGVARAPLALDEAATARVAPRVSASGFSWPTASTRRAAGRRSTTAFGTAPSQG